MPCLSRRLSFAEIVGVGIQKTFHKIYTHAFVGRVMDMPNSMTTTCFAEVIGTGVSQNSADHDGVTIKAFRYVLTKNTNP